MGFFKWSELFKKYPQLKDRNLYAICGPRNIGKSYDTYEYTLKVRKGFTEKHKVAILRNSDQEAKMARQDFNSRFNEKMKCFGNMIFTLKKSFIWKDGEKFEIFSRDKHVGYLTAISTYTNMKSIEAKDIKTIIYEEFNEDTCIGRNIYPQFINIITTLIRFSDCTIFMLGNKDGYMSDYYVNWNIIPSENTEEDAIFNIGDVGYWIELGNKQFADLKNNETVFYKLAMMDNRTKNYLKGGYIHGISKQVMNYNDIIQDFKPIFYIAIQEQKYILGKHNNTYAILSPWNFGNNLELRTYSLDLISRLLKESQIIEDEDVVEIVQFLLTHIKSGNIVFDSYDTLQKFKDITLILKSLE